jgi:trehalose 6-phosphate synthase
MSSEFSLGVLWSIVAVSSILSLAALIFSVRIAFLRRVGRAAAGSSEHPAGLREHERLGAPDDALVQWSPEMLRHLLESELPDGDLIVVSNREPYIHERTGDRVELHVPASGLVSALEPITRTCAGTWIAHGSGSADRETVDGNDRIGVPPSAPAYTLRRVWLTEEEYKGYYFGFANEGLWPLCHIAFTRPVFRAADWECYQAVNRKFAEVVVAEAKTSRPIILVQDYHFALLPRLVREKLPDAIIITFWHIPWPNAEVFGVCPWREQILDGLLGSSILGFHIQLHCNNFMESVDRYMESRIDKEDSSISYNGGSTTVRPYPISIEWPEDEPKSVVEDARRRVFEQLSLPTGMKLALGVERLDYTKGILDRFHALDEFFQQHSDWIGHLVFVQVAAPSRSTLSAYGSLQEECRRLVDEINDRYGTEGYQPIILLNEHHDHAALLDLYRAADLCVVSSLHDGMNLVAKEFVAARVDEQGVLVLSAFAGASRELGEALLVNPFDAAGMADAFYHGLTMTSEEVGQRMWRLRETVRTNNVYRWAGSMLLDAARLRKRNGTTPYPPPWESPSQQPSRASAA